LFAQTAVGTFTSNCGLQVNLQDTQFTEMEITQKKSTIWSKFAIYTFLKKRRKGHMYATEMV